jgi:hypothetical protein
MPRKQLQGPASPTGSRHWKSYEKWSHRGNDDDLTNGANTCIFNPDGVFGIYTEGQRRNNRLPPVRANDFTRIGPPLPRNAAQDCTNGGLWVLKVISSY